MKSLTKALMALILIVAFFACKKDIETTNPEQNNVISLNKSGNVTIHKLIIQGKATYVNEINGEYYYAEDITISKEQFNALRKLTATNLSTTQRSAIAQDFVKTWPNSNVYFKYPDSTTMTVAQYNSFVNTINIALDRITAATGIQFIERSNQTEYLKFVKSTGNNSPLGWQKDRVNTVNLYNYNSIGILSHEVLHSLGISHEQSRPDRDLHVIVDTSRVTDRHEHNFNIDPKTAAHGAFDFGSVMMYSATSFAKDNNFPTITKLDGSLYVTQRDSLSNGDKAGLRSLYTPAEASSLYKISPIYANTKSFDIPASNTANGTNIIIYSSHSGNNQKFIFRKTDHGYYQIKSKLDTTKVLTVRNASNYTGTQVELRTNTSADHQKFKLYNRGNDGYSFAPKHATGLRLEVTGGSSSNGTNIIVSTSNTALQSQRFNLTQQ